MNKLVTRRQSNPPYQHLGFFSVPISCCGGYAEFLSQKDKKDYEVVYGGSLDGMVYMMMEDGSLPPTAFDDRNYGALVLTSDGYRHRRCIEKLSGGDSGDCKS